MADWTETDKADCMRMLRLKKYREGATISGVIRKFPMVPRSTIIAWQKQIEMEDVRKENPSQVPVRIRPFQVPMVLADEITKVKEANDLKSREEAVIQILFEYFHPRVEESKRIEIDNLFTIWLEDNKHFHA